MKTGKLAQIHQLINQATSSASRDAESKMERRKAAKRATPKKKSVKGGSDAESVTSVSNAKDAKRGTGPAGLIRFQGYFREREIQAIRKAQAAFIQKGFKAPPENQIVRIALQTLSVDDRAIEVLEQLASEKRQR